MSSQLSERLLSLSLCTPRISKKKREKASSYILAHLWVFSIEVYVLE